MAYRLPPHFTAFGLGLSPESEHWQAGQGPYPLSDDYIFIHDIALLWTLKRLARLALARTPTHSHLRLPSKPAPHRTSRTSLCLPRTRRFAMPPLPTPPPTTSPPHHSSIAIQLDSPDLVLRALPGNESSGQTASLAGTVELKLSESTNLKNIVMTLRGAAKIDYVDPMSGKRYQHQHPLFFHQLSFLPECSDTTHAHTLQAGYHRFPFSVSLPADLPATLKTYSGSGSIYYKLKALATRAGFLTTSKWEEKRILRVARSFPAEAVEWNQMLEIENTWPGS